MKRKEIRLNQIDLTDERFRISYFFDLQPLLFSIKKIGVLNLPVVTVSDGHYVLVCGWKRVLACRKISVKKITVWVAEGKTERELLLMSFYENWATREFSVLEKAEIIRKLKDSGEKEEEITRRILPLLNIPSTLSYLDTYIEISRMDPEIKRKVYENSMGFKVLQLLGNFNLEEQKLLIPWLIPVGKNKQQEIIQNIQEIACKEGLSPSEIFQLPQVESVSQSEKLSSVQKADKLREELVKIRFPLLSRRREAFHRWIKEIQWPPDVDIYPAPHFEENWYTVQFRFKSQEEYEQKIERLYKLNREKLSKIFHE